MRFKSVALLGELFLLGACLQLRLRLLQHFLGERVLRFIFLFDFLEFLDGGKGLRGFLGEQLLSLLQLLL